MTILHSILLGILQGLTEFIPVSSTAHLLIAQKILNIPSDEATFSFLVIVQLGTLVSLFVFYGKDLLSIARAMADFRSLKDFGSLGAEARLGWFIILATIPALMIGYLLKDAVEELFKTPLLEAAIRLLSAALLLSLAEWLSKKNRQLDSMTRLDALIVGSFQVVAIFPGASRSGSTIAGGMLRGFDRPSAARFAFLMSMPVMLAAGGYQTLDVIQLPNLTEFLPMLAFGFIAAAIVGWFAIKWLIDYLGKRSLYAFAAYCAILGSVCLIFWMIG